MTDDLQRAKPGRIKGYWHPAGYLSLVKHNGEWSPLVLEVGLTTDDLKDAIERLERALDFHVQCRADLSSLETGAMQDARIWVFEAAVEVVTTYRKEPT